MLEHDPAPALAVALRQEPERGLNALPVLARRLAELCDRERRRRDHEQRLDGSSEPVDRVGGD